MATKLTAKDVMTTKPKYLPPSATLKQAADEMLAQDFGFVPIGENDRLIGAITDRDIAVRGVANGKDPNKTRIDELMTDGIHYCFENDDLAKIAAMMEDLQIRRLVVLNNDKDKRMTGILSFGDIATRCKDHKLCAEIAEGVSKH